MFFLDRLPVFFVCFLKKLCFLLCSCIMWGLSCFWNHCHGFLVGCSCYVLIVYFFCILKDTFACLHLSWLWVDHAHYVLPVLCRSAVVRAVAWASGIVADMVLLAATQTQVHVTDAPPKLCVSSTVSTLALLWPTTRWHPGAPPAHACYPDMLSIHQFYHESCIKRQNTLACHQTYLRKLTHTLVALPIPLTLLLSFPFLPLIVLFPVDFKAPLKSILRSPHVH